MNKAEFYQKNNRNSNYDFLKINLIKIKLMHAAKDKNDAEKKIFSCQQELYLAI